jgi:transcriptional regulator with XRE-family HTH domain
MAGIGGRLRTIRRQWQLSLREVEKRSHCFAQERGNQSYKVSASWLDRLEREEHELTVNKLIALADIYNLSPGHLLRAMYPPDAQSAPLGPLSSPNATMLLSGGHLACAGVGPVDNFQSARHHRETRPYSGSYDPGRLDCSHRHPEARHLSS